MIVYLIIALYLSITFGLGFYLNRSRHNEEGYFMANRSLSTFQLFLTLIATNFSAFFFLGFASEAYTKGYAYYAMAAFGTSFAAVTFYLIGEKALHYSKSAQYVTPVEMIGDLTKHQPSKYAIMLVYLLFMFPYLAIQPIGAGLILENLTNGGIPYFFGVILMVAFIIAHILIGGMKGVVLLDVKNGILMLVLMSIAAIVICHQLGGLSQINATLFEEKAGLFHSQGKNQHFNPKKWISYMLMFNLSIACLPQLFTRFMISKSSKELQRSTLLYSIIPIFLFLLPVIIGLAGHTSFPDLEGKEADGILSMMLVKHSPKWFAALILTGALAAFISTMDSLLLALGTIISRDLLQQLNVSKKINEVRWAKISIVIIALISLYIAQSKPQTIFALGRMTLSAMAILFPVFLLVLRWNKLNPWYYFLSIILGELTLVLLWFEVINIPLLQGYLPLVPALMIALAPLLFGALFIKKSKQEN